MDALGLGVGLLLRQRATVPLPLYDPAPLFAGGEQGAYYDAADMAGLFQDSAGTIPAAVGAQVGRLGDRSGWGNHAVQTNVVNKPVLRRESGLAYLEFNGSSGFLACAYAQAAYPLTIVAAARFTTGVGAASSPSARVLHPTSFSATPAPPRRAHSTGAPQ